MPRMSFTQVVEKGSCHHGFIIPKIQLFFAWALGHVTWVRIQEEELTNTLGKSKGILRRLDLR